LEKYFEVPFFKALTDYSNWNQIDDEQAIKYHVARAMFKMIISHMPGPSKLGRKIEPFGSPASQERVRTIEVETEKFNESKTIEKSIIESLAMGKILSEFTTKFGDGKIFNIGGKVTAELSNSLKENFHSEFQITNTQRERTLIRYEFRDTVNKEDMDRLCGAEVYQRCRADLYLLRIDFLNIEYKKKYFGLRKKIHKCPFPKATNTIDGHPNIIRIGTPIAELQFWQLLPGASVVVKDTDYIQEVENDSDIEVKPPRSELIDRPYWRPKKYPSLYQLSCVAFPNKYINKPHEQYTRDELMDIELGEAEESVWWYLHGPGRNKNANK